MDLPESACSPDPNKVYDRDKGAWVGIKEVTFWQLLSSTPLFWAAVVFGGYMLIQWLRGA